MAPAQQIDFLNGIFPAECQLEGYLYKETPRAMVDETVCEVNLSLKGNAFRLRRSFTGDLPLNLEAKLFSDALAWVLKSALQFFPKDYADPFTNQKHTS